MTNHLIEEQISKNLAAVDRSIKDTCKHVGVNEAKPKLIAVSKVQPLERIQAALEVGHRIFGENRLQEAEERWEKLKPLYKGIELHLIGSLQTNKVSKAVSLFDVIHTVDRIKLARKLAAEMKKQGKMIPVYLQVNTGQEDQKGGCFPESLPALVEASREAGLNIAGLMCIPPQDDDPTLHFALLSKLAKRHGLKKLSMGMSGDFALAASMGATDIRVGTAIFGERDYA